MQMCHAVNVPGKEVLWSSVVLERTKGSCLARGDVVLLIGDKQTYEIIQGTATGLTPDNVRIAVSSTREQVLNFGVTVLRVMDAR